MPPRSVTVTYTLHPTPPPTSIAFTAKSPLLTVLEGIRAQTPLTNLHWKPTSRTSLRTIQSADVTLVELGEAGTLGKEVAGSLLEWPLTNLCLVLCEMYKNQTKSFIRDWLSLLAARRNSHAPLIVLVNPASSAASSGKNVFGRDKGVIAKLRADFNTPKRDRCVQVNLPADGREDPAIWVEVINKLKESIVSALDNAVLEREEDIKRGEAQRMTVGWNFCTWFLLKESLAHSFEGVNLNEDALVVYEELEASFLQVLKEQNLSWFGKLGATGPKDDSLPILDTTTKPYRELLQTSSISIFDFRVYVFARQAQLLGKLGRITEIAKRGQWFVASLTRRLRENEADLAENFIESWTYTASMDIVHKCDEWSRIDRPNGDYSGLIAYESARSELLDIARTQVERIGVVVNHLPNEYPFAPSSAVVMANDDVLFESSDNGMADENDPEPPAERGSLSNRQLLDAIADKANFQALYATLTKRTIAAYEACNKANSVIRLKADLAALSLLKEDWRSAYELCRDLARDCAEQHIWEPASRFALGGALRAHLHLSNERDEDWINLALAYLRTCAIMNVESGEDEVLPEVLTGLRQADLSHTTEDHKAFEIRLVDSAASWSAEPDVSTVKVSVINGLPFEVSMDQIQLNLFNAAGERVEFTSRNARLSPGPNEISADSSTAIQGLFTLRESKAMLGKVVFAYPADEQEATVRLHRNPAGPRTVLRMPYEISLDKDPVTVLEVHAGKVDLHKARVVLLSGQEDVQYQLHLATSSTADIKASHDELILGDLKAGQKIDITIPYAGSSASEWARSRAVLRYTNESDEERLAVDHHRLSLNLPLTVNVQDFFRPQCLVSHFTIASDGREHLRIGSVRLEEGDQKGYEVESARKDWTKSTIITPAQPLSCLFKIHKRQKDVAAVLRLVIKYRSLEEELRDACNAAAGSNTSLARAAGRVLEQKSAWLQEYISTGKVGPKFQQALAVALPSGSNDTDFASFIDSLREAESPGKQETFWRTLEIPVDIPQQRLLTSVRYEHTSPKGLTYEGRAISLNMIFSTSFDWLEEGGEGALKSKELAWDVTVSQDDWIILGRKKGHYTAEPGKAVTQEIVLVPVRSGRLFLPNVHVQLLRPSPENQSGNNDHVLVCETYVENAVEVVDVLPATKTRTVLVPIPQRDGWDV